MCKKHSDVLCYCSLTCTFFFKMPHFAALGTYIIAYIRVLLPNGIYLMPNLVSSPSMKEAKTQPL